MQFTKESGELITYFIPHVTEKKENRSFNKILLQLYRDILKADEYVNDKMNQNCFKTHLRGKGELLNVLYWKVHLYHLRFANIFTIIL